MKWLDKKIILETTSIDIADLIFSLLSLFCSVITILIYLRVKSLRTIIYRLFFHIAINETISRIFHIIQFINIKIEFNVLFEICIILIYFTDTNILIFVTFSCYSMYELILKQNKNINYQLSKILIIAYCVSGVVTIIFFILPIFDNSDSLHKELYRNVIALKFIKDDDKDGSLLAPLLFTTIIYSLLVIYAFYKVFLIQWFIRSKGNVNEIDEDEIAADQKRHKSLKLASFQNKMIQYPLLGLYFLLPLAVYSWIEYSKETDNEDNKDNKDNNDNKELMPLRIRFYFYNINCFINSIRGYLYFRVFISNEKIKLFLFKKYLTSSIFKTIDKINPLRERAFSNHSKTDISISSDVGALLVEQETNDKKRINSISITDDEDEDELKLVELNNKDRSFEYNNNSNDDDEIKQNISHDSKSETAKIKGNI